MLCPECGADNRSGRKFCLRCGTALQLTCSSCGATNEPSALFCGECGTSLGATGPSDARPEMPSPVSQQERRLVSVLFADLVGFTTLSESRDAEEVGDLLTRYFDDCRSVITRYGGVVEKFIGDAVMAVWGTPVATENDAERAVRASLELVQAVQALGAEAGAVGLRARTGVVTGEDERVRLELSGDLQDRASYAVVRGMMSATEGRQDDALSISWEAVRTGHGIGIDNELVKACFAQAGEAALALDDRAAIEELLAVADRVIPPFFKAHAARFRARLAAMDLDDAAAEASFWWAAARFRDIGANFYVAVTLLEHGEWLLSRGRRRDAHELIEQARSTFEQLGARPWLERVDSSEEAVGA